MQTVIGPVLARTDGYAFDTWTHESGLHRGFGYRRIDDAYYARNAALAGDARPGESGAIVCNTLDAFLAQVEGAALSAEIAWQAAIAKAAIVKTAARPAPVV
jgi:hypothetical protein